MCILIVSANPLLKEVIVETFDQFRTEFIELSPEEALGSICELRPDVIIIDETIPPPHFEGVLAQARSLQKTRAIVLNPIKNEVILLDSRRTMIRKVDDLKKAISSHADELAGVFAFLDPHFNPPPDADPNNK